MEISSLFHEADSPFSYPISMKEFSLLVKAKEGDISSIVCFYAPIHRKDGPMPRVQLQKTGSDGVSEYWSCVIGKDYLDDGKNAFGARYKPYPGYVYYFEVTGKDGSKKLLTSGGILDTLDEDPSSQVYLASFPNRADTPKINPLLGGYPIYQIFPDRFNRAKDEPNLPFMNESKDNPCPDNFKFCGGSIGGIIEKLPYLVGLGVGAIYLNPIFPSSSAHRYDVEDYLSIDPRFGTMDEFLSLAEKSHSLGIRLCLDLVFNHCSSSNPIFQDVIRNGKRSPYCRWFFLSDEKIEVAKKNYLYFGFNPKMPKLDTSNEEVISYFANVMRFWLLKGVDGFRLDVSDEVSHAMWMRLKEEARKTNPNVFFIGEQWNLSPSRLGEKEWDGVMNYPFRYAVKKFLLEGETGHISNELTRLAHSYAYPSLLNSLSLVSSHDTPRLFTLLQKDKRKMALAFALEVAFPGVPDIYYGEEIFMEGGGDPGCRKYMEWGSEEFSCPEHALLRQLFHLRSACLSLREGSAAIERTNGLLHIEREIDGEKVDFYASGKEGGELGAQVGETLLSQGLLGSHLNPFSFVFCLSRP